MRLDVSALILAAGRASRMGVAKVLLPAGAGHTLLSRVLCTALGSVEGRVAVVLGRDAALCEAEIERCLRERPQDQTRVVTVHNPRYEGGLSTSLRAGVREVLGLEPGTGTIILLADQPAFGVGRATDLIRTFRSRRADTVAVAAAENGEQRNPVIFSAELLPELLGVEGDRGAKEVLKRHEARTEKLELGSGAWFADTDDWAAYAALMRTCAWTEEVFIPEADNASAALLEAANRQMQGGPQPRLASDVLLVGLPRGHELVRLELVGRSSLTEQGIRTVIAGDGSSPSRYLNLLRQAATWTLQR